MKLLIIGAGGREHALAWKAAQSPRVEIVFVAPGNAGTAVEPKVANLAIPADDTGALITFAADNGIDLTIVGPEAPLVAGLVDAFDEAGLTVFGPHRTAAQLEGSKEFAKDFMARHGIPTAEFAAFTEAEPACHYARSLGAPLVVKADGLAAGKGVVIAHSIMEAEQAIGEMISGNTLGGAGQRVVIEEYLTGEELSFICIVDGKKALPLASSQDHKARDDGDQGPNTGGMGAYSPAPRLTPGLHTRIMQTIVDPTVAGMAAEGQDYRGFLYAGLMVDAAGDPRVLEFNCRLGDPETQPLLMRLRGDLTDLCLAACNGRLQEAALNWDARPALGVVMAADGYPGDYAKGDVIRGLADVAAETKVFHAGTALKDDQIITDGGRVVCVTALGDTVSEARAHAYASVKHIHWRGAFYRRDIGHRAVDRN